MKTDFYEKFHNLTIPNSTNTQIAMKETCEFC